MTWTQQQYIDETRAASDSVNSVTRWTPTSVLYYLGACHLREWKKILDANPYYRFAQLALNTGGDGSITLASLNTGGGDTQQNHYRILGITDGSRMYDPVSFREVPLAVQRGANSTPLYYLQGSSLQLLPVLPANPVTITVNWIPTAIDNLASNASVVDFPDHYELILTNEAAAMMLTKAGAESGGASVLLQVAQQLREQMHAEIARHNDQPLRFRYSDSKHEWAG